MKRAEPVPAPITESEAYDNAARVFLEVLRTPPQPVRKKPAA